MKPIKFKECNTTLKSNDKNIADLPALVMNDNDKIVVTCWKLSFVERIKILVTGKMWNCTMTFGKPLMPVKLTVDRKEAYVLPTDKDYEKI